MAQKQVDTLDMSRIKFPKPRVYNPVQITGRLVGMNLEILKGAIITNICTADSAKTDDNGIYHIQAAKGDTLVFYSGRYPVTVRTVKSEKERYNAVLMQRKTSTLERPYTQLEYEKAKKEDDNLYKILDKDAKLEGRWNY